jgi:hypothetical protein
MRLCSVSVRRVLVLTLAATFSGCVAPAFNLSQYESKVAKTADEAASALQTARLAVGIAVEHGLYDAPIGISLSDSEDTLGAIEGTFASVEPPPDAIADALRAELLELLDGAGSALERARIEFRRGKKQAASLTLESAEPIIRRLQTLAERF